MKRVIALDAKELDVSIERREIDHAGVHERIHNGRPTDGDLAVRRVHDELLRPELFKCGNIARQRGRTFLVIERANERFIRHIPSLVSLTLLPRYAGY